MEENNKWVAGAISPIWVEFYTHLKLQGAMWKSKKLPSVETQNTTIHQSRHHVWQKTQVYEFSLDLLRLVGIEKMPEPQTW